MTITSAAAAAQRLQQLHVPMRGATPAPGEHAMRWADFEQVFGFTEQRRHMIQDLQVGLDAAKATGATKAWIGGSLSRLDKPIVGDADFVVNTFDFGGIPAAVTAAHAVQGAGGGGAGRTADELAELIDERINVFPEHDVMLDREWIGFMKMGRPGDGERGLIEIDLADVPGIDPTTLPHTHPM